MMAEKYRTLRTDHRCDIWLFSSYRLNPTLPIDYDDWTTFFIQKDIYLLQNVLDVY